MSSTMPTVYVEGEGSGYLDECMEAVFRFCKASEINVLVIFTSSGLGPCKALDNFIAKDDYSSVRVIAVTPPVNKQYRDAAGDMVRAGTGELFDKLRRKGVPIVSARLPFRSILAQPDPAPQPDKQTVVISPSPNFDAMHAIDRALGMLGGGISLCVQAALMASDAGAIAVGETVVAMSADTAIVTRGCHSEAFLSPHTGMLIDHIICRPRYYTISKTHHYVTQAWGDVHYDDDEEDDDDDDVIDIPSRPSDPKLASGEDEPEKS